MAIIITAVCMASCSGASKSTSESGMTAGTGMAGDGVVEKTLKLGSFNAIKSEAITDIHFAQGAKRSVRVRATQNALDRTDISVAQSTLTIKEKSGVGRWKGDSDRLKITLFVTAPELKSLNNQGIMNFDADRMNSTGTDIRNTGIMKMKVEDIHDRGGDGTRIENKGQMKAVVRTVDARLLTLDNTGILAFDNTGIKGGLNLKNNGRMTFAGDVDGNTARVDNTGACEMKCKFALSDGFSCMNNGQLKMTGDVKAAKADIQNTGMYDITGAFNVTDGYSCMNKGQLKVTGDVKASVADIRNTGTCDMKSAFRLGNVYSYENKGRATNTGNIAAQSVRINNSGTDNRSGSMKADKLSVEVNGHSQYDISYSGGDAGLNCKGLGEFRLALDCRSIDLNSGGRVNVTLTGTADKTSLYGSGISNVNTTGLNKF